MAASSDLLADPGVLPPGPGLEIGDWQAVARQGGLALLHWRRHALAAEAAGVNYQSSAEAAPGPWPWAAVAAEGNRAATLAAVAQAACALQPGGLLLLHGGNDQGIRGSVRAVTRAWGWPGEALVQRAHARVHAFRMAQPPAATAPATDYWQSPGGLRLRADPGVFPGPRLDRGSAVLLQALAILADELPPPQRLLDLGCGGGVLALEAARLWPQAQLDLADGDARAIACAAANLQAQGRRGQLHWWDSAEVPPVRDVDLVLCNPPWHVDGAVDRSPGLAMCRAAGQALAPGGQALVVATRTQPFEPSLAPFGALREIVQDDGFKVLALRRAA
ncbi:MAG: methyltransferase domain-containing protein [Planctomycetota bacterium]|nr:MAG: methyltransferase domain-containing protein [Planctomycetota bacterium]